MMQARTTHARIVALVCSTAFAALATAGCSSSKHANAAATSGSSPSVAATRWWSNAAVSAGSTIDASDPTAAAGSLRSSQTDYCGMLRQTLASGKTLSGIQSVDPKLTTSVTAFVAEIEKVAPANVTAAWQVLGAAYINVLQHGASVTTLNNSGDLQAAETIASDAKSNCGVDLSKVITGS